MILGDALDRACKNIISPDQFFHRIQVLCPKEEPNHGKTFYRIDFDVRNQDGKRLAAMILTSKGTQASDTILYLHGNGGCKLEALGFRQLVCKNNINVICFDFLGCGNSESGYLTYGVNESKDISAVLRAAKNHIKVNRLSVWGRSMGALAAIMYCERNHHMVSALILDSPFQFLEVPVVNVIKEETKVPDTIAKVILYLIRTSIEAKLPVPIFQINYLEHFRNFSRNLPVMFFYSSQDSIVPAEEVLKFYNSCKNERESLEIPEKHEQDRSTRVLEVGINWIKKQRHNKKNCKIKLSHWSECVEIETVSSFLTC